MTACTHLGNSMTAWRRRRHDSVASFILTVNQDTQSLNTEVRCAFCNVMNIFFSNTLVYSFFNLDLHFCKYWRNWLMKMKMSIQSRIGFQLSAHHKIWNSREKINLCQNLLFKTKVSRGVLVTICFGTKHDFIREAPFWNMLVLRASLK